MSESAATLTPKPKAATARLEARISADLQLSIKRAAELQGRTITDFVVAAVQEEHGRLDILVNNAGPLAVKSVKRQQ